MDEGETPGPDAGGSSPVRLLVVEDSATLAEALLFAFGFEEDIDVVGVAPTIARALEMVVAERPHVVLMDVRLPDGSGLDATAQVVALRPDTAVIIVTAHADHRIALQAAEAGASGFLVKDVRIAKIVAGVRRVVAGGLVIDPAMLQSLLIETMVDGSGAPATSDALPGLSALERDVVVAGTTAAIRDRLSARSNLEAVVRAARAGLLGPRSRQPG